VCNIIVLAVADRAGEAAAKEVARRWGGEGRFPHRRYRVLEADCAEIEQAELTGGGVTPRPGNRHYRANRYLTPYACLSLPVGGPADIDPESLDEEMARAIFKHAAPDEPRIYLQGGYTYAEILSIIEAVK
jgi:hypothetical protein